MHQRSVEDARLREMTRSKPQTAQGWNSRQATRAEDITHPARAETANRTPRINVTHHGCPRRYTRQLTSNAAVLAAEEPRRRSGHRTREESQRAAGRNGLRRTGPRRVTLVIHWSQPKALQNVTSLKAGLNPLFA
jgi:hypothetical protein